MEIIGIVGFVFAAAAIGALVYERRTDVLHGPYIEGRTQLHAGAPIWDMASEVAERVMDRLAWKTRNAIYLASLA